MTTMVVVASAVQAKHVRHLQRVAGNLTVVWCSKRGKVDVDHAASIGDAITPGVGQALFLSPTSTLSADVARCRQSAIDVRVAGPIPGDRDMGLNEAAAQPLWGEPWRHDGQWCRLLTARRRRAFGDGVFYRRVSGGGSGGALSTWWALWHGMTESALTLSQPFERIRLNVTRVAPRRGWHATLHILSTTGSSALVGVTPQPDADLVDRMLVGTGGSLTTQATDTGSLLIRRDATIQPIDSDAHPLSAWIDSVCQTGHAMDPPVPPAEGFATRALGPEDLLTALRRAGRDGKTIDLL